uniref:Type IV / VI secretion system DotU domain-containing protein n=1 Tax=Anopheles maculatus TaxID=74869 RepID=A0A182S968_9DIPT
GKALYQNCCKQVEHVREALIRAGYDDDSVDHISYAQCALLDETVMSRRPNNGEIDEGQLAWRMAPLQARYFDSLHAGEALWDRLANVLRQPAPVTAVLTCYHRVLSLGFQGLYGVKTVSQTQRDETLNMLNERVAVPVTDLSLVVRKTGKRHYTLLRSVWFWIAFAAVATGGWGKGLLSLVVIAVACRLGWLRVCHQLTVAGAASTAHLPPLTQQGPVVLVCGDGLDALFAEQPLRETAQGCWLRVGDVAALADVIRTIQLQQPRQLGQLAVMYSCLPDEHQDEAV